MDDGRYSAISAASPKPLGKPGRRKLTTIGAFIVGIATIVGTIATVLQVTAEDAAKEPSFCDVWPELRRLNGTIATLTDGATEVPTGMATAYNEMIAAADRVVASDPPAEIRDDARELARLLRIVDESLSRVGYDASRLEPAEQEELTRRYAAGNVALINIELYFRRNC